MDRAIILYTSRYGSTKRYAQWIQQSLGCPIADLAQQSIPDLHAYDTVIFGGGLYASGIAGAKKLRAKQSLLQGKNLLVFTVGIAPVEDARAFETVEKNAFPSLSCKNLRFFHFRGAFHYQRLNLTHKAMMSMMRAMLQKKEDKTDSDLQLLDAYQNPVDFCEESAVSPLVQAALDL